MCVSWSGAAANYDADFASYLPYCDFIVARARTLAGLAADPDDDTLRRDLARLKEQAQGLRWPIGWSVGESTSRASA